MRQGCKNRLGFERRIGENVAFYAVATGYFSWLNRRKYSATASA